MNKKRDYYEVLGVSKTASLQEIKTAYRRLAKKYHPDVSSEANAQEKFKEVSQAYQILSDPEKRQKYDQFGHAGVDNDGAGNFHTFFKDFNFEDIFSGFSSFFDNQHQTKHRKSKNSQAFLTLNLTFKEAMHGVQKTWKRNFEQACQTCNATGAQTKNDIIKCSQCHGKGYEINRSNSFFGMFQQQVICSKCRGQKVLIKNKCHTCRGKKFTLVAEELTIDVPKGVSSGQQMRYPNKGSFDEISGKNHDLYIEFNVSDSPLYRREENDLFVKVPVSYLDSLLGNKISIPTIDGEKTVKLEVGISTGRILRLRNYGAYNPNNQNQRGDLYVEIIVNFPKKIPRSQKSLIEKMVENNDFEPNNEFILELKRKKLL